MQYQQLVQPNLHTGTGKVGLCLSKQEDVWGVPHGKYEYAKDAWNAIPAQYKHAGQLPPTGVAVLMWWDYLGNEGHVATSLGNGSILSSPYSTSKNAPYQQDGNTQAVLPSRAVLERIYSSGGKHPLTYLGWSEYIIIKRVVQPLEDNMLDEVGAKDLWRAILHREPENDQVWRAWVGKSYADAAASFMASAEWKSQDAKLKQASGQVVSRQMVLDYINGNLK